MLNRAEILKLIPQGDPFVFVDTAVLEANKAVGTYTITGEECFMKGHFPGRPIFPASIMMEALGQLGIVYMVDRFRPDGIDLESIFLIKSEDCMCRRKCMPGDRLDMEMKVLRSREPLILFSGVINVEGALALKVSSMSLSFSTQAQS